MDWRTRYQEAHEADFKTRYPSAYADGHYTPPVYPDVRKANGLTNAICNYLKWVGGVGNRINTMGRIVEGAEKTATGQYITKKKWIKSSTQKGTADLTLLFPNGKVMFAEIKCGKDRPSDKQLAMQERIRKSGGIYEFIYTIEQFFEEYDRIVKPELFL